MLDYFYVRIIPKIDERIEVFRNIESTITERIKEQLEETIQQRLEDIFHKDILEYICDDDYVRFLKGSLKDTLKEIFIPSQISLEGKIEQRLQILHYQLEEKIQGQTISYIQQVQQETYEKLMTRLQNIQYNKHDYEEEKKQWTLQLRQALEGKEQIKKELDKKSQEKHDNNEKLMSRIQELIQEKQDLEEQLLVKSQTIEEEKKIKEEIQETLVQLNRKGFIKMLAAFKEDELKGAILLVKGGNYYTYILGGSKKEVPDLRTGDFLQWEAIKLAILEGLDGYNISLGGSKGVVEFKNSFNTEQLHYDNGQYHWVLKPLYFKLYLFFEKKLKPHKKTISKVLSKLKR
jgi:hypothetical protein